MPDAVTLALSKYGDNFTVTREELLASIAPGGRCSCGEPAVVRYVGGQAAHGSKGAWHFNWPRCGTCPGAGTRYGVKLAAMPMEPHHRAIIRMLGHEQAWVAALRLGYRPDELAEKSATEIIGQLANINITAWER